MIDGVSIEVLDQKGMEEKVFFHPSGELEYVKKEFGVAAVFSGFTYFSPNTVRREGGYVRYVTAFSDEAMKPTDIVGVVKVSEFPLREGRTYKGTMYTDVRIDWQRKGIATGLWRKLNTILEPTDILISSSSSELAKEIGLKSRLEKLITACPYFHNLEHYSEKMII